MIGPRPLCLLLALSLAASCNRAPAPRAGPTQATSYEVEFKPLTVLTLNLPTHIAVDSLGNICWVQESESADDSVFIMGEGDIPRTTELTVARIAAALGAQGGTGNIQSLAASRGGGVYFYFLGKNGRKLLACVGLFTPKNGQVRVLADANALMDATDMGRSLGLARGTIVSSATDLWLWIRHSDAAALFHLKPGDIPGSGAVSLASRLVSVRMGGKKIQLNHEEHDIAAGAEDMLYWFDLPGEVLRQIDRNGDVTNVQSLVGLPLSMSLPARDSAGRMLIFAADAPFLEPTSVAQLDLDRLKIRVNYPALLVFSGKDVVAAGRENMTVYPGFPLSQMRLKQLVLQPRQGWITYDSASGQLLLMKVKEVPAQ